MTDFETADYEALFRRALISRGETYLVAESELRDSPESAAVLRANLNHPDPVGRLAAKVMLEWQEAADGDFDQAVQYLDRLERRFAATVAGEPPITGVVENLTAKFGGRLSDFLALRLVQQPQAAWRTLATLAYLDRHKNPAATEPLIRFAARTESPRMQRLVAGVLAGLNDPALGQKLETERQRLAAAGRALPAPVAALSGAPGQVA